MSVKRQLRLVLLLVSLVLFLKAAIDIVTAYTNILHENGLTFQVKDNIVFIGSVNLFGLFGEMLLGPIIILAVLLLDFFEANKPG